MRYISSYKLFENNNDIINGIKDILIELDDEGYETEVRDTFGYIDIIIDYVSSFGKEKLNIPQPKLMELKDKINSVCNRIKQYMESNGHVEHNRNNLNIFYRHIVYKLDTKVNENVEYDICEEVADSLQEVFDKYDISKGSPNEILDTNSGFSWCIRSRVNAIDYNSIVIYNIPTKIYYRLKSDINNMKEVVKSRTGKEFYIKELITGNIVIIPD